MTGGIMCEVPVSVSCPGSRKLCDRKKKFMQGLKGIDPCSKVEQVTKKTVESEGASEILPWLHLGGWRDAEDEMYLRQTGITKVLNITPESATGRFMGIEYMCIPINDNSEQPIDKFFTSAFDFLDGCRAAGDKVLVHCRQGVSRSATIVVAYLMKSLALPMILALDVVRQRRPVVNPNIGFMDALQALQAASDIDLASPISSYQSVLDEWSLESSLMADSGAVAPCDYTPPSTPNSHHTPPTPTAF